MKTSAKSWGILFALTVAFIIGRLSLYGVATDSVAANDTETYFQCAQNELNSIKFFECSRSAAIPFLFKLLNPQGSYEITSMSEPFFGSETRLVTQPGTGKLVILQTLLSVFSWVFFTLTFCSYLQHELPKITAAFLVYAFALVPQIADWDSILLSESMSFSFFILLMAFLILFLMNSVHHTSFFAQFFSGIGLLISAVFWTFTRDTNGYFTAWIALVLLFTFVFSVMRKKHIFAGMLMVSILLSALFTFQQITFRNSQRWLLPFLNNMAENIFPYPDRVDFFENRGMPVSDTLLSQSGSAEYNQIYAERDFIRWAAEDGLSAYQLFLLDRPIWTIHEIFLSLDDMFSENIQPFFYGSQEQKPHWADKIGNLFHPLSASVLLVDLLLLAVLYPIQLKQNGLEAFSWWIFALILVGGSILLIVISYLGEVRSIIRHVLGGVMGLRLSLWLLGCILFDLTLSIPPAMPVITRLAGTQTPLNSDKIE